MNYSMIFGIIVFCLMVIQATYDSIKGNKLDAIIYLMFANIIAQGLYD